LACFIRLCDLAANGWLYRQKRALADKSQKAKKAIGVNPTQKRRTTPLLSGASGVRRVANLSLNFAL
jgi:hypothetical protein